MIARLGGRQHIREAVARLDDPLALHFAPLTFEQLETTVMKFFVFVAAALCSLAHFAAAKQVLREWFSMADMVNYDADNSFVQRKQIPPI